MNKKKSLVAAGAIAALATVTLVSCGGSTTYTITLDVNDAGAELGTDVDTYKVTSTKKLLAALADVVPTKEGYTFAGWYLDDACTIQLTEETNIKDIVKDDEGFRYIYAGFEINDYTVTFNYKGNAATAGTGSITTTSVNYGASVAAAPTITTAAKDSLGHEMTFTGWYKTEADATAGTNPVTLTSETINGNTTFYAGWTITKISTAEEFAAFTETTRRVNAYIANDITLTDALVRTAAGDSTNEKYTTNGTDMTSSFTGILYGDNHKITGLTINSDLKSAGLWGKFSGTIQDIKFESPTLTSSGQNSAIIAGTLEDGATFSDVTFDGAEVTNTASNGYAAVVAAQIKDEGVTASFDGVNIINSTLEGTKYNGGVLATIVGKNCNVSFTDCLVDLEMTCSGESNGLVFGYANKDKSTGSTVSFDGVVATGKITAAKNLGAIVGNNKDTATTISIKNSAVVGFTIEASGATASQLNTFIGQDASSSLTTMQNCYYQEYGVSLNIKGSPSLDTEVQGTAVSLETLATKTLSSNIALAYDNATSKITITSGGASIEATDPIVVDMSTSTVTFTSSASTTKAGTAANSFITQGTIPYNEAAVAGKAGHGVLVTFSAPKAADGTLYTNLDGLQYAGGDLLNVSVDATAGTVSGYLILSDEEKTTLENASVVKTVSIIWFKNSENVATTVEYTVTFPTGFITLGTQTADGQIGLSAQDATHNDTTPLTAEADGLTKLNVTAGQIDFESDGNYVYVSVAKPNTITSGVTKDTIKVTNGTVLSYADGVATVKVKISAKGDNKFTLSWSSAYDPDNYTINVANEVVIEEGAIVYNETFSATSIACTVDNTALTQDMINSTFFTLVGSGTARWSAGTTAYAIEVKDSGIQFTVIGDGQVTLTANVASTGGTNMSLAALYNSLNATVAATSVTHGSDTVGSTSNVYDVYSTDNTTLTYTLSAGTYTLKMIQGTSTGGNYTKKDASAATAVASSSVARGGRIINMTVKTVVTA